MRGSFERDARGNDWWVGTGRVAVSMARDCAAKARQMGRPDIAVRWDWWVSACTADPTKRMRVSLPPGVVIYERHSKGTFGPNNWWDDL
jgi:hypothetical protein